MEYLKQNKMIYSQTCFVQRQKKLKTFTGHINPHGFFVCYHVYISITFLSQQEIYTRNYSK
jgi:hypothetical protein